MFDGRFKVGIEKCLVPVGHGLKKTGITADHLTALGLIIACGAAVAIGSGALKLGFLLLVLSALPDLLDGAVAKASGSASPRGAFFDSTADRVTDSLLLGGVAWHLDTVKGPHYALLPFAILGVSAVISYMRAKAESLGYNAKGGLMERAERIIVLALGLLFDQFLYQVLWVMLVLSTITAIQRFVKVWRQASNVPPLLEALAIKRRQYRPSSTVSRTVRQRAAARRK